MLEDVTSQSLVLIDELGKGTEVFAGSALSGAVIERLAASRCRGIFATHLHLLHEMDLDAEHVEMWRMEVVERSPAEIGALAGGCFVYCVFTFHTSTATIAMTSTAAPGGHLINARLCYRGWAVGQPGHVSLL